MSSLRFGQLSFRTHINLLGGLLVLVLFAGLAVTWTALRNTESAIIHQSEHRLEEAAAMLASNYQSRADFLTSHRRVEPLKETDPAQVQKLLALITEVVLRGFFGVEGGFYSAGSGRLLGYAFPTHEGSAPKTDVPEAERKMILDVATRAVAEDRPVREKLVGMRDVVLFYAVPLGRSGEHSGSAWVMKRLPGIRARQRIYSTGIPLALGLASLGCVGLAFVLARSIQRGVGVLVTGLRRLEADLDHRLDASRSNEEIREIAAAVNRLAGKLREKIGQQREAEQRARHAERLASLGQLVAGVAHEVRNPLATIRLRAQMLRSEIGPSRSARTLDLILGEVARLDELIGKLLIFGRTVSMNTERVDLGRLLGERLAYHRDLAAAHHVELVFEPPAGVPPVPADPAKITQVFDNLIQNAIDAMAASGGLLTARLDCRDGNVYVEIADQGPGIPQDLLGRIFDPFFSTKDNGTGLGLSICYELMQSHGGDITVSSEPGAGSRFRLRFPL